MGSKSLFTGGKTSVASPSKTPSKNLYSNQPPKTAAGPIPSGPTSVEQQIYGLEQRVQQLETQVQALLSVIEVGNYGQTVRLHAHKVELDAALDLQLKAGMQLNGSAGTECQFKAGSKLDLQSGSTVEVKGTMMRLNNGSKPLAFGGDPVVNHKIVTGTSKVFA